MDECAAEELLDATACRLAELPPTCFASRAREPEAHEPYGRSMLIADGQAELLLMCWAANRPCAPHDHGDASGLIRVLEGQLTETRFRVGVDALEPISERELKAGDVIELDVGVVHQMRAHVPTRTLHLYRPRIRGMRVWDEAGHRLLVVDDSHGAFVPKDARWVVTETPWPTTAGP